MSEIAVQLEGVDHGRRHRVLHEGAELGVWRDPEHSAARVLVAMGYSRRDVLVTYRGSTPCMRGRLGWFADRSVSEGSQQGLRIGKWAPFPKGEAEE